MPVIVFLLDNSASMNQMTHLGTTLFDIGKGAIEQFLKIRQRDTNAVRTDRYMLLTLDEPPANIKVAWREPMNILTSRLKSLDATGLTQMGPAIKQAFDLLNLNRHAADHDTYGCGRFPHLLDPSLIIAITDKQKFTSTAGVHNEINIPMNTGPFGSELTREPFRWDQRLFAIVLALPAQASSATQTTIVPNTSGSAANDTSANQFIPPASDQPVTAMCDVTGGRSFLITSQRSLNQCLESLVQKIQHGVVVNLEKVTTEGETERAAWYSCRKMIMIPRTTTKPEYYWPIPEDYLPSATMSALPVRSAHALIKFQTTPCPIINDRFPSDKYELEPSPLTQYILERRQSAMAWPVYVQGSSRHGPNELGSPFGYLKASSNLTSVNLYVMPYNYPELLVLLNEWNESQANNVSRNWQTRFDVYLRSIPHYYLAPLRRFFTRRQLAFVFESFDRQNPNQPPVLLPAHILRYLNDVRKKAKTELERWPAMQEKPPPLVHLLPIRPDLLFDRSSSSSSADIHELSEDNSHSNFVLQPKISNKLPVPCYMNVFEIPRSQLIDVVIKLRRHFLQNDLNKISTILPDDDALHSVPIKEMSNYDEYPRANGQPAPLREIDAQPVRQHVFGNPFKVNKPIDEIDEFVGSTTMTTQTPKKRPASDQNLSSIPKRKRTTLVLKNYVYRRQLSLSGSSGPPSPAMSITSTDDESEMGNVTTSHSFNQFSFDIQTVLDDDRQRILKKYRDLKKKIKVLFRRHAAEQEILPLLNKFIYSKDLKEILINELIYECHRLYPSFETRLREYKQTHSFPSANGDQTPSSTEFSSTINEI